MTKKGRVMLVSRSPSATKEKENVVRVKVGTEYPDGTLDGEEIEFEGREVEVWEGPWKSIDPNDQFVATFRLYDCPDGYRIHESVWSASGQPNRFELYPPMGKLG